MKKTLSMLLAILLTLALAAGCSEKQAGTETPSAAPDSASTPAAQSSEPTDNGFAANSPIDWGDNAASDVGQEIMPFENVVAVSKDLPLCGEKTTFSAWWPISSSQYFNNYNEVANHQELENRTNIHIDYYHPSTTEVATAFPLMIASNDYCDMIFYAELYTGGGDKALDDEVYIRLNDLIDGYAPNYNAMRNSTPDARKMTITSAGNIWGFYSICYENMPGYMGLNINQNYLDQLGYDSRPVTISDWDEVLGRMLNEIDAATYALAIPPTGVTRWSAFVSAWDVGSDWYQVDGVAKYGPLEEGFRNYVELMKNWYDKGYLRSDFYAVAPADYNNEITWKEYGSAICGAADGSNTFGNMLTMWGAAEDINTVAVRQPVLNEGDETHIRFDQGVINGQQLAITTACKNPELLTSWIDYRYTCDGFLLLHYGIEGLTYKMTGKDYVSITDNIINNPDGVSPMTYRGKFCAGGLAASLSDYTVNWCFLDPAYAVEIQVWGQDKCDHNYPNIECLTAEDGAEFAAIYSDIETYVYETVPKMIIGSISMDKYDDFVAQIKAMGIDRTIELKQIALDDYNSR